MKRTVKQAEVLASVFLQYFFISKVYLFGDIAKIGEGESIDLVLVMDEETAEKWRKRVMFYQNGEDTPEKALWEGAYDRDHMQLRREVTFTLLLDRRREPDVTIADIFARSRPWQRMTASMNVFVLSDKEESSQNGRWTEFILARRLLKHAVKYNALTGTFEPLVHTTKYATSA